ncbi:MAG: TetR/AcrR family transcriptional regulator [Polyangiales bacterium]
MPLPRFHKLELAKQLELLDAAATELAEHGYEGASIASVVERAGASKSAVYYYFEDKEDLFQTVLERSIQDAMATVGEHDPAEIEADFWGALRRKKRAILEHFAGRPVEQAIWRLAMAVRSENHPHPACIGAMHNEVRRRWITVLETGRRTGAVRTDLDLELAVNLLLAVDGLLQQYFILEIQQFNDEDLDAQVERSVDLIERLLRPQPLEGAP